MKKKWQPARLEGRVQGLARRKASDQLLRVSWNQFHETQRDYLEWEAFALWVRAIVEIEGRIPQLVIRTLKQRCPAFWESEARLDESTLLAYRLQEWIHNRIFARVKQEGWLDALIFYGVRDVRSRCVWSYWEHCEREWERKQPSSYPSFQTWLRTARNYDPYGKISVVSLSDAIERYVDWVAFDFWLRPIFERDFEVPKRIAAEVELRLPGLLAATPSSGSKNRMGALTIGRKLKRWIEAHRFSAAKKRGWLALVRQEAHSHPRYIRIEKYSDRWRKKWPRSHAHSYPTFSRWCHAAENYIED